MPHSPSPSHSQNRCPAYTQVLVGVLLMGYALAFAGSSAGHGWYLAGHVLTAHHETDAHTHDDSKATRDHAHDEEGHHHHGLRRRAHFTLPPSVEGARVKVSDDMARERQSNAAHAHDGRAHVHAMPDDGDQASRVLVLLDRHQLPPASDLPILMVLEDTRRALVLQMVRGPEVGIETPPPQIAG